MVADSSKGEEWPTVIGADATFKGELSFQGSVKIDGNFEGSITTPGKVYVSKTGKVKAEVQAGTLAIDGAVTGNVAAEGAIVLNSSCKLKGDLRAGKLQVREGATWSGHCEVGSGAGKAAPASAAPMRQVAAAASGKK